MKAALLVFATTLLLAGCNGGTVDRHALTNDAATLDSIACEGGVLADGVARGRTSATFVRVQSDVLRVQASNLADALGSRHTVAGIEERVRAKGREAARVALLLEQLHTQAADQPAGVRLERALRHIGSCP